MLTKEQLEYKMAAIMSVISDIIGMEHELSVIYDAQITYLEYVLGTEDEGGDEYNKNNNSFFLKISERKTKLLIATLRHNSLVEELKNEIPDLPLLKTFSIN